MNCHHLSIEERSCKMCIRDRLYTDLSLFRIDFPLLYFPRVSFAPWLFPLRRSTFRLPFTKCFL